MFLLFAGGSLIATASEQHGNPALGRLGIAGGNMEGKEVRFGVAGSALFSVVSTASSDGAVNSAHDSFTPLAELIQMLNLKTGEVIFGGTGSGILSMILMVLVPKPSPTMAPVTLNISRMPGPPLGPSLRMTTTSPDLIFLLVTAVIASSSDSKTRAGPRCSNRSCPLILATQPSGARFPFSTTSPPVFFSGLSNGAITSWPGASMAFSILSAGGGSNRAVGRPLKKTGGCLLKGNLAPEGCVAK